MAFIGCKVPHETARLLSELDVPGERESSGHFHITMLYLGDEVPIERLAKAIVATYSVTSQTRPFTVQTSRVTSFPTSNSHGYPIICRIDSDALHDLRRKIVAEFDAAGIEYDKKFPEYKPHLTLGYAENEPVEERRIPTVEWGAHELVMWGGDEADRRLVTHFPFSIEQDMVKRVASRYLGNGLARGVGA